MTGSLVTTLISPQNITGFCLVQAIFDSSWWLSHPVEKYARKIGFHLPQGSRIPKKSVKPPPSFTVLPATFLPSKKNSQHALVGGFNPFEKYAHQNGFIFPK